MRITLIANKTHPRAAPAIAAIRRAAAPLDIEIDEMEEVGLAVPASRSSTLPLPDFYLALGGDGSVLRALQHIDGAPVPLASINTGTLGFLTCADTTAIPQVLRALKNGEYTKSVRSMLQAQCHDPDGVALSPPCHALNDAVALRSDSGQTAHIAITVDDEPIAEL
ncbi:MAG: NAD(+)/NADH kinase, partial [Kiritimatiellaeota bacterium]|nr:NAD(+)/NADH kinase [Kiritimatiellota bacterium]